MDESNMPTLTGDGRPLSIKEITGMVVDAAMEKGGMGLSRTFSAFGNATAMVLIAVLLFASLWYVTAIHTQAMATQQILHQEAIGTMKAVVDRQDRQRRLLRGTLALQFKCSVGSSTATAKLGAMLLLQPIN